MIKCEKTTNGGTLTVLNEGTETVLSFRLSDTTDTPLVLFMECSGHQDSKVQMALADNLVNRYCSPVVFLKTENAQVRYSPWLSNHVFRHSTKKSQSLYTKPFSEAKAFNRLWSLAECMNDFSFVRSVGDDLQVFDRYAVLKQIRLHLTPFEFLSVKEECDYAVQKACIKTTRNITEAAKAAVSHSGKYEDAFSQIIARLDALQTEGSLSFDRKTAYLQEAIEQIFLPSVVLFGSSNPMTKEIVKGFVSGAAEYTEISEGFMGTYEECLKYLSTKSNELRDENETPDH